MSRGGEGGLGVWRYGGGDVDVGGGTRFSY
jgi:hypothetical protein